MPQHRHHALAASAALPAWRVNMTAAHLRAWLSTFESHEVGFTYPGERESVGRQSAHRIVRILEQGGPRSADDIAHMRKVAGYNARHLAQRPAGDVRYTRWRYSLMNWGGLASKPAAGRRF